VDNTKNVFAFIMAGGSGERFWPMSRQRTPKHLLRLLDDRTLLETTVARLAEIVPLEQTFILTNAAQFEATCAAAPSIPVGNVIAEPAKRDTAPACALATAIARARNPEAICAVLPADAMIHNVEKFQAQFLDAADAAATDGAIVTLGIPPTGPATGFGYLETGEPVESGSRGSEIRRLQRFVEKPDTEKAIVYFESGRYFWNAGIFLWKASTFVAEAKRQQPALAAFIEGLTSKTPLESYLAAHFVNLPKISVDYAIMEHATNLFAVLAEFDWDDVGAWTALPAHLGWEPMGNCTRGPVVHHASTGNIAISNGRTIALCGVSDLVVVETPDAILVCHKDAVQHVKNLQPHLPEALK
jgi:mannose-1-phosphate guanylyltransferase